MMEFKNSYTFYTNTNFCSKSFSCPIIFNHNLKVHIMKRSIDKAWPYKFRCTTAYNSKTNSEFIIFLDFYPYGTFWNKAIMNWAFRQPISIEFRHIYQIGLHYCLHWKFRYVLIKEQTQRVSNYAHGNNEQPQCDRLRNFSSEKTWKEKRTRVLEIQKTQVKRWLPGDETRFPRLVHYGDCPLSKHDYDYS